MQVDNLMFDSGPDIYYDPAFRNVLEDFMTILRNSPNTKTLPIAPQKAYKYEHDLFGLLSDYGVSPNLHWIVMRMNGFDSPTKNTLSLSSLIVPNPRQIEYIRQSHMTTRTIS